MKSILVTVFLISIASLLASCNGTQDYSNASLAGSGSDVIDGVTPNAGFDPSSPCEPRTVGSLYDSGTVRNITYMCGGYLGHTGLEGTDTEKYQGFFVCPYGSTEVDFMLGNEAASLSLGKAQFRTAAVQDNSSCSFDATAGKYTRPVVSDGPYLLSISDLFDSPARVDVTGSDADSSRARNISALLASLNTSTDSKTILIDDNAHAVVNDGEVVFPDNFLDQGFADFVSSSGFLASTFLPAIDAVSGGPDARGTVPLPADEGVMDKNLAAGGHVTASGRYRFDLILSDYTTLKFCLNGLTNCGDLVPDNVVVTSSLPLAVAQNSGSTTASPDDAFLIDDGSGGAYDSVLFDSTYEFRPFMIVDRRGRVSGGGSFDIVNLNSSTSFNYECSGTTNNIGVTDYLSLTGAASLMPSLQFSSMQLDSVLSGSSSHLSLSGRYMQGQAYNGVTSKYGTSDYEYIYQSLPDDAHNFNIATDKTALTGTLCNTNVSDQPVLGLARSDVFTPNLRADIMSTLFGAPKAYTLSYTSRQSANDKYPSTSLVDTLKVTVHQDGTILSDLNGDGNDGSGSDNYDPGTGVVPSGEYAIGMVTSVFPGIDDPSTPEDETLTKATANIVIYNYSPNPLDGLPMYGSHFEARLIPSEASCNNHLSSLDLLTLAVWYNPYAAAKWLVEHQVGASAQSRYEMLRTSAYGYVLATDTGAACT